MWKGGFMNNYIINDDVLCFTQDSDNKNKLLVIEKNRKFNINGDSFKFLKKCCRLYGHSYSMQRQFVIDNFDFYIKTPIILSEYNMIIFFPTTTPSSDDCIWISYNNVDRYVKENNYTKIYFKGGNILNISASYSTIDNQITKCIKIEKYIRNRNLKNMSNSFNL